MRRAVFLDRDGVINRAFVRDGKPYPPAALAEFELLPGVIEAVRSLRNAGFLVIVVTNQPDVKSGAQRKEVVVSMHEYMRCKIACDDIKVCYHDDSDCCDCRKPNPGMLVEAAREWDIALSESFLVGDRWRDIAAGKVAGCRTYFIDCGYRERGPDAPDELVADLCEACDSILRYVGFGN